jgi:hypothetical protein
MEQALIVAVSLGTGLVIGAVLVALVGAASRRTRRAVTRARGADRPEWAPGIWMCAHCRSSNHAVARTCATCRRPREDLPRTPVEIRPDWIPERIEVPAGTIVALVHDPAAHADPGEAHWQVRVAGVIAGSASRREGALALLRRITGSDAVLLDVHGTGAVAYRLADVIARFEAPRFPLDVPCPERGP